MIKCKLLLKLVTKTVKYITLLFITQIKLKQN